MDEGVEAAVRSGMMVAWHAARRPQHPAVISQYGERSYAELNANANRLVRTLRAAGIGDGDAVAVASRNRPEFIEAYVAAERSGIRLTPVNFHLTGEEIGYIVNDCEAKAFIADAALGAAPVEALASAPGLRLKLACGGALDGFDDYADAIAGEDASDIADPTLGTRMLYTSGTTGRPKGVYRATREPVAPQWAGTLSDYRPDTDVDLCTGPAYHAAPLLIDIIQPIISGVTVVMMDKWSPEETLRLIEQYRVTHSHMVATMFHRLLQLPEAVRAAADVSSLRLIVHGAAPCPVHVKQAIIEWFGPVVWEYYAATEGGGGFMVGSQEWLNKPGTVGKPGPEFDNRILDDEGNEVGPGEVGTIYMRAPDRGRFEYFKDTEKTAGSYRGDYFTLGDMGYFDEDGYLFLTGRSAELIISGGVNIYPQEVDSELMKHPAVHDVCTIGVPNEEWGEAVKSVIALNPGVTPSAELEADLTRFARERRDDPSGASSPLPRESRCAVHHDGYKCPRSFDFVDELPRSAAGKIQRRKVREPYWAGRDRQI